MDLGLQLQKNKVLPINIELMNYQARKAQGRHDFKEACRLWEKAIELEPSDGRAWLGLARFQMNTRERGCVDGPGASFGGASSRARATRT